MVCFLNVGSDDSIRLFLISPEQCPFYLSTNVTWLILSLGKAMSRNGPDVKWTLIQVLTNSLDYAKPHGSRCCFLRRWRTGPFTGRVVFWYVRRFLGTFHCGCWSLRARTLSRMDLDWGANNIGPNGRPTSSQIHSGPPWRNWSIPCRFVV